MARSSITQAIVLKRINSGETDRLVTLLCQDSGKTLCVAKGVRKLKSSNRANLEPGNLVKVFLVETKGLPLLTQSQLLRDAAPVRRSLTGIRQLTEVLEIFDRLFVENDIDSQSYQIAYRIYRQLLSRNKRNLQIKAELNHLLESLGYQSLQETKHHNIADYVAELSEKKMHSYDFLQPKKR